MRTIGLIGAISWESTAAHYCLINDGRRDRLWSLPSAQCELWSFNFVEIVVLQHAVRA
jgi:aspartate racemase